MMQHSEEFYEELAIKEAKLNLIRERMVEIAFDFIGTTAIQYRTPERGISSEGFDCSGFISALITQAAGEHNISMNVPRHANEQWRTFGEPVDYSRRISGDLVYFPSRSKRGVRVIGHVGLVVSSGEYVHSPGKNNTVVTTGSLPSEQQELPGITDKDIYTRSPAGIKRISLPIGSGRWHVY